MEDYWSVIVSHPYFRWAYWWSMYVNCCAYFCILLFTYWPKAIKENIYLIMICCFVPLECQTLWHNTIPTLAIFLFSCECWSQVLLMSISVFCSIRRFRECVTSWLLAMDHAWFSPHLLASHWLCIVIIVIVVRITVTRDPVTWQPSIRMWKLLRRFKCLCPPPPKKKNATQQNSMCKSLKYCKQWL